MAKRINFLPVAASAVLCCWTATAFGFQGSAPEPTRRGYYSGIEYRSATREQSSSGIVTDRYTHTETISLGDRTIVLTLGISGDQGFQELEKGETIIVNYSASYGGSDPVTGGVYFSANGSQIDGDENYATDEDSVSISGDYEYTSNGGGAAFSVRGDDVGHTISAYVIAAFVGKLDDLVRDTPPDPHGPPPCDPPST